MRFFVSYSSVRLGHIMSSSFSNGENGSDEGRKMRLPPLLFPKLMGFNMVSRKRM